MFQNKKNFQMVRKYNVLLILFVFITSVSFSQTMSVSEIRKNLDKAQHNEKIAEQIYNDLNNSNSEDATIQTLDASATAVMALHVGNPMKKLKFAKKASEKIDAVVAKNPKLLEARLIRFSIQSQAPGFLGLSKDVEEDVAFLKKNFSASKLKGIAANSKAEYIKIFEESGEFNSEDMNKFRKEIQ